MKSFRVMKNGVQIVYSRKGCHSCEDCIYYVKAKYNGVLIKACSIREISNQNRRNFPYDNTTCEDFKDQE